MKKRCMAAALSVLSAAMLLGGCVPKATSNTKANETTTPVESSNFNETGLPIVNEPVSITLAAITSKNKNFEELVYFQQMEESTNVDVNWNMNAKEGWDEKKALLFAGNNLPDAFYGYEILTEVDVIKYASQGMLIPLNDLIDKYAPNLKHAMEVNPTLEAQITASDGNIYSLPTFTSLDPDTYSKLFINKNWLDQLGLEVPETLDEFEAVLKEFKANDLNGNGDAGDEIPFTFRAQDLRQQNLAPMFGSWGQVDDYTHFIVDDGTVIYTAQTEPWKEGIEYFNKLYSQGLMDPEGFTHDFNVYVAKIQDPSKIVGAFLGWSCNSTAGPNRDDFIALAPLKGPNGDQLWANSPSKISCKSAFAITKAARNPEVIMRWIDESYEPENSLQVNQGLFDYSLEKTENGGYRYLPLPEGKLQSELIHDYGPGTDGVFGVLPEVADKLELNANLKERAELDEFYAPYNVPLENVYPSVLFDIEEIDRISVLKTDIDAYVEQNYANWISKGGIEEEWDAYVEKLKALHVDEYIQIYQQAYDRYARTMGWTE